MNYKYIIGLIILITGIVVGWIYLGNRNKLPEFIQPERLKIFSKISPTPTSHYEYVFIEEEVDAAEYAGEQGVNKGGQTYNSEKVPQVSEINYTDDGFVPNRAMAKTGTIVRFTNNSQKNLQIAPAIKNESLKNFDSKKAIISGNYYEYEFTQSGTYKMHNALHNNHTLVIEVLN